MSREAMELALEALEGLFGTAEQFEGGGVAVWRLGGSAQPKQAIAALRLAIDVQNMASESTYKQQTQEPVAWISPSGALYRTRYHAVANAEQSLTPLYTTPPQRKPLTDEQIYTEARKHEKFAKDGREWYDRGSFARAIEAAHNIKE